MRRSILSALVVLLVSGSAAAQVVRGPDPFGRPTLMRATSPMAYWVWVDPGTNTWHVRTTTTRAPHTFHGVVTVEGRGVLTHVKPTRMEWNDSIRLLNPKQIKFRFQTQGGIDGFDFKANSPFVRFDVFIDGRKHPDKVFVGQANQRPAGQPFDLFGPKLVAAPPPPPPPPVVTFAPPPLPWKRVVRGPDPQGRPWFTAASPMAYWIWRDAFGTWHVRTTTARAKHVFHGYVTVQGGRLTKVTPSRKDWKDWIRLTSPSQVQFKFETHGGMDGFDFHASSPSVRFDIYIDGRRVPKAIFVGWGRKRPAAVPFDLYVPPPPPAMAAPVAGPPPMGAPVFAHRSPQGFWVWADPDNTWHVRTVSKRPRGYAGEIWVTGGKLSHLRATQNEWGNAIYLSPDRTKLVFHIETGGFGTDGFDFRASTRAVSFDVRVDGKHKPRHIHVGAMGASPAGIPFRSVNALPAPPPPPPPPPAPASPVYGRPPFAANSPMAYWIWADRSGQWHLYVTTARAPHRFHGRIVTDDGQLTQVTPSRVDWRDKVRVRSPRVIEYDLKTQGTADGFKFRASSQCIRFYPQIDGRGAMPQSVFFGAGAARPATVPFKLCR